jgi:molybdate transport system substrate-binding protein
LKKSLLSAKSLVYMDPSKGGSSGIHFAKVVDQMGIADTLKNKTVLWPSGYAAEALLKGEAEICIHQISEILAVKGVAMVGPLPKEIQKVTIYPAGLVNGAASPEAAKAFIQFLMSPSARPKFVVVGLDYKE